MREKENKRERDCVGVSKRSRGIRKEKRRKDLETKAGKPSTFYRL